jgi:hypothetical protein
MTQEQERELRTAIERVINTKLEVAEAEARFARANNQLSTIIVALRAPKPA